MTDRSMLDRRRTAPGRFALLLVAILAACSDGLTAPQTPPDAAGSVEISPDTARLPEGGSAALNALVRAADGRILAGRSVTWRSTDTTIVSVEDRGRVLARRSGEAWITAIVDGRLGRAFVEVAAPTPTVASVEIVATDTVLDPGTGTTLRALVRLTDGTVTEHWPVQWSSSDEAVLFAWLDGSITGNRGGTATVTAAAQGKAAQLRIRVTEWRGYTLASVDGGALPFVVRDNGPRSENGTLVRTFTRVTGGTLRLSTLRLAYRQELVLESWDTRYAVIDGDTVPLYNSPVRTHAARDEGETAWDAAGHWRYTSTAFPGTSFTASLTPANDVNTMQPLEGEGGLHQYLFRR